MSSPKVHSKKEDFAAKKKEEEEDEYLLVPPARAKDTGLTGKYWEDMAKLPARRSSKSKPSTPVTSTKATPVKSTTTTSVKSGAGSPRSSSRTATPARDEGNLARQGRYSVPS